MFASPVKIADLNFIMISFSKLLLFYNLDEWISKKSSPYGNGPYAGDLLSWAKPLLTPPIFLLLLIFVCESTDLEFKLSFNKLFKFDWFFNLFKLYSNAVSFYVFFLSGNLIAYCVLLYILGLYF